MEMILSQKLKLDVSDFPAGFVGVSQFGTYAGPTRWRTLHELYEQFLEHKFFNAQCLS